uniref:Integrase catalytic domain-containing protein n=1 Tax=Lactuca sativa TaxID=4236 RepID=A0A9R1X019_LACSA|nr:hypothetical protein LSAT_V11C800452380 [Lactuca sativa]
MKELSHLPSNTTRNDVLRVPTILKGLVSMDTFDKGGFKMELEKGMILITKGRRYVRRAKNCSRICRLCLSNEGNASGSSVDSNGASVASVSSVASNDVIGGLVANVNEVNFSSYFVCSIYLLHKHLAPTNVKNIEKMQTKGILKYDLKDFEKCETNVKSKFTKKPFPSVKRNTSLLDLIHFDICELNGILTRGGKRSKEEAFDALKLYKAEVENELERHIKILHLDRGGEYFNQEFDTFYEENGIKHERISAYTPQ